MKDDLQHIGGSGRSHQPNEKHEKQALDELNQTTFCSHAKLSSCLSLSSLSARLQPPCSMRIETASNYELYAIIGVMNHHFHAEHRLHITNGNQSSRSNTEDSSLPQHPFPAATCCVSGPMTVIRGSRFTL